MTPRQADDQFFPRDVQQILRAGEVGIRWADQVSPLVTFRWLSSRAPVSVQAPIVETPMAVVCLRAVHRGTQLWESMCRVTWRWIGGRIRVEAIDVSDSDAEYDITLGLVR